ncbi:MAG: HAD-IIIA family hydrolase [Desulfosalsimonas sp.]
MSDNGLEQIRLLLFDADGVLTTGQIVYSSGGDESKSFDVRDGFGIRMLKEAGLMTGIITGRHSEALERRAGELKIDFCRFGARDKKALLEGILEQAGCSSQQTAFIGDDLIDIGIMKSVGVGIAVADAHEAVRQHACIVTSRPGGRGAVREVCERILKARGLWEDILRSWVQSDFPDSLA